MRASLVGALGLAWVAGVLGCAGAHSPCGSDGTFVADRHTKHCVYSLALPIVIEGGFECPSAMPFEFDLNANRVCSARPFDPHALPPALCAKMPELCSPAGKPDAGAHADTSRPPVTWSECSSRMLEEGMTGDRCAPATEEGVTCGTAVSDTCGSTAAICDPGGILKVSEAELLECAKSDTSDAGVAADARVYRGAADCEAALAEGHSFGACEESFVCARRTEDPCCIEYALCNTESPLPTNLLMRYRLCERGCADVKPDERREPVTDCSVFDNELTAPPQDDFEIADLPCEGDFVCWGGQDLSDGRGADLNLMIGGLRWCSEGVVRGQHSSLGPLFIPASPPAP
jgi:hypothetical protein